jgi:SAM-dependent methyltransferase
VTETELDRIRAAYEARDAATSSPYRWDNPSYVTYMQIVERALLRAFRDAGIGLAGARVLDVGAGSGYFLHRLKEYGAGECHGIDLMESRVASGRARYPALQFHVGSATELPFRDGEFDLVSQFTCLSSILDDDVRLAVAREMRRVSGGWILSFDMRGLHLPALRLRREGATPEGATPTVGLNGQELRRLFGEPELMRRVALPFELAQLLGRFPAAITGLAALPPLRSHVVGLWRTSSHEPSGTR